MDTRVPFPHHLTTCWSDFDRRPPQMRYSWPREQSFEDRRARAASLPWQYRWSWAQYLSDVMDADKRNGSYYAYEFWTTAPWGQSYDQIALSLQRACECATSAVFPELRKESRKRRPLTLCAAAMMLPAQAENGTPHIHGFIRIHNTRALRRWRCLRNAAASRWVMPTKRVLPFLGVVNCPR